MKYNPYTREGKVARRTKNDFFEAFRELVCEISYDEITVNDICERANYPRTTFYNYFGNTDNLLRWSLDRLIDSTITESSLASVEGAISAAYSLHDENKQLLSAVRSCNDTESRLFFISRHHVTENLKSKLLTPENTSSLPDALMRSFHIDVLVLLIEWLLFSDNELTREDALHYYSLLSPLKTA